MPSWVSWRRNWPHCRRGCVAPPRRVGHCRATGGGRRDRAGAAVPDPQQAAKDPEAARAAAQQVSSSLARYLPWLSAPGIDGRIDRALSKAQGPMLQIEGTSGMPVFERMLKHALENKELALYKIKGAAAKFAFLLMPISLPFLWLLLVTRRRFGMFDHAVFSLYSLSAMALLMSAAAIWWLLRPRRHGGPAGDGGAAAAHVRAAARHLRARHRRRGVAHGGAALHRRRIDPDLQPG